MKYDSLAIRLNTCIKYHLYFIILYLYMSQCILCPSFIIAPEVPRDVFIFFVCPAMCNYFYNQAIYSFSEGRIDRTDRWV